MREGKKEDAEKMPGKKFAIERIMDITGFSEKEIKTLQEKIAGTT